jgi:hypothetical protein
MILAQHTWNLKVHLLLHRCLQLKVLQKVTITGTMRKERKKKNIALTRNKKTENLRDET